MPKDLRTNLLTPELRLPAMAAAALIVAIVIVIATRPVAAPRTAGHGSGGSGLPVATQPAANTTTTAVPAEPTLSLAKQVGQLIIATYQGETPPATLLAAIRKGEIGAVILMGDNTGHSVAVTKSATDQMQQAARQGDNPGLLIMTDQEGGQVKRLPGPPDFSAADMSNPAVAYKQGLATGQMLTRAGVNVDLAPVADVVRQVNGFINQTQRSFGSNPTVVGAAACQFAAGLARVGVAYTLKHFPGLGDAVASTDNTAVAVDESSSDIYKDDLAYRKCGHSPLALVMVSSASYVNLTGTTPAVLDPSIYGQVMREDHITALPISDSFESGAIQAVTTPGPARAALNAGLDMVMYPDFETDALDAYSILLTDAEHGTLSRDRVQAASTRVLQLKASLKLRLGDA